MNVQFLVSTDIEHETGKFESKEELADVITEELRGADPGSIEGPNYGGTYNTSSWEVSVYEPPTPTLMLMLEPRPSLSALRDILSNAGSMAICADTIRWLNEATIQLERILGTKN